MRPSCGRRWAMNGGAGRVPWMIVGISRSRASGWALAWAAGEGHRCGARLLLVRVFRPPAAPAVADYRYGVLSVPRGPVRRLHGTRLRADPQGHRPGCRLDARRRAASKRSSGLSIPRFLACADPGDQQPEQLTAPVSRTRSGHSIRLPGSASQRCTPSMPRPSGTGAIPASPGVICPVSTVPGSGPARPGGGAGPARRRGRLPAAAA